MLWVFRNVCPCQVRKALSAFSAACWQWNRASPAKPGSAAARSAAARRSRSALTSQARVSATNSGSGGCMEQRSLPQHGCWQRRRHAAAALERRARPDDDVRRGPHPPKRIVGEPAPLMVRRGVVRHHDQHIVIAVRPGLAARLRAEEVDPLRPIGVHETAHDLGKYGVMAEQIRPRKAIDRAHRMRTGLSHRSAILRAADPRPVEHPFDRLDGERYRPPSPRLFAYKLI